MHGKEEYLVYYFVIVCSLVVILLALVITNLTFRYQQKQILNKTKIEELKSKHENNLLKSQLQVQEQTFQNISREIHDNIGQKLTLAKLQLNTLIYSDIEGLKQSIANVVQIVSESLNDLRDISRSLSSELILNNGLIKALEHEIHQLNRAFLYNIKLTIIGDPFFMIADNELVIFRIIQESLNNIMKHAEATQVDITFCYSTTHLEIEIVDNGKGFDIHQVHKGNGIHNIFNRAASLLGTANIDSRNKIGTKVNIKIPNHETGKV